MGVQMATVPRSRTHVDPQDEGRYAFAQAQTCRDLALALEDVGRGVPT